MKPKYLFLTLPLAFSIFSCADEIETNCQTATFSWKENGVYHEGHVSTYFNSFLNVYTLNACEENGPSANFRLQDPVGTGTYSLAHVQQATGPNTGDAFYYTDDLSDYYTTDSTHTGTVTISAFDTDSAITGTFSFTAIQYSSGSTISITEGTFTAIP